MVSGRRGLTRSAVLAALTVLPGCADAADRGDQSAELARWRLSAAPTLSIGGAEVAEEHIIQEIRGIVRLPDGRLAVADGAQQRIRVYDAAGRHVTDWGRPGTGPGEYRWIGRLFPYRGDSLAVYDLLGRRLTVLDAAGNVGRIVPQSVRDAPPPGTIPSESCCNVVGAFADGSFLVALPESIPVDGTGTVYSTTDFVRLDAEGAAADTIATVRASEYRLSGSTRSGLALLRLAPRLVYAARRDGFVHGNGETRTVTARDAAAGVPVDMDTGLSRRPVTDAIRAQTESWYRAAAGNRTGGTPDVAYPDSMASFDWLVVDREDRVWVRETLVPGDTVARYRVLTADGRPVATIELPEGLWIQWIDERGLLGVERDAMDVAYVREYRIIRP